MTFTKTDYWKIKHLENNIKFSADAEKAMPNRWLYRVPGVYSIKCKTTQRVYYGCSWSIFRRLVDHLGELHRGCHKKKDLQDDYNKYGIDDFEFIIESYMENVPQYFDLERRFINESFQSNLSYNIIDKRRIFNLKKKEKV